MWRVLPVLLILAAPLKAQDDQTLADIRQELTVLYVEVQKLRRELSTTGAPQTSVGGASTLDRVNAIESELQRLTSKTEELEFRIDRIVRDGTNRIGDLEFRLVELEGGDVSQLGETTTLGGDTQTAAVAPAPQPDPAAPQLATQEQSDFEVARAAYDAGDFVTAAAAFAAFNDAYPGGPMAVTADLYRGRALQELGDTREAARAFLAAFRVNPTGPDAPEALYRLGATLGRLGQTTEACLTLAEVPVRFPGSAFATEAQTEMGALACS